MCWSEVRFSVNTHIIWSLYYWAVDDLVHIEHGLKWMWCSISLRGDLWGTYFPALHRTAMHLTATHRTEPKLTLAHCISISNIKLAVLCMWYCVCIVAGCDLILIWTHRTLKPLSSRVDRGSWLWLCYNLQRPCKWCSGCLHVWKSPSLWPSGIGSRLGRNRLWVRFLAVSDIYVHWAYDYLGHFGVLWVRMAWHN